MYYQMIGKSLREVILERSIPNGLCWFWQGTISRGWGHLTFNGKMNNAHIFSYIAFKGIIPKGMTIDHLCRNRSCVNPNHLEIVSNKENSHRGNRRNLICLHKHKIKSWNLMRCYYKKYNIRFCKKCHDEGNQIHQIYYK